MNPPVHAWATLYLFKMERTLGRADMRFLERSFQGLMLNFNWWVNRKDPAGRNVFAGGFLGLDNIGVFDRSAPLPTGGSLDQADGTAWMAFYCQSMLEMALILAEHDPIYEEVAFKFVQHFIWIAYAMDRIGEHHDEMWDEEDGFFYDLLRTAGRPGDAPEGAIDGRPAAALRVDRVRAATPRAVPEAHGADRAVPASGIPSWCRTWRRPTTASSGTKGRRLLSILNKKKLERVLAYMLDENEFLGPYGIRSLSRYHQDHPFMFWVGAPGVQGPVPAGRIEQRDVRRQLQLARPGLDAGQRADHPGAAEPLRVLRRRVQGGVSDRVGPVHDAVRGGPGDRAPPRGHVSPRRRRTAARLRRDGEVPAGPALARPDLFYEYFHGDNGAGLGASHQTGWTGLIAVLLDLFARLDAKSLLETERDFVHARIITEQVAGARVKT